MPASRNALTSQQYTIFLRYIREALPLSQVVDDASFVQTFPEQMLPSWIGPVIDLSVSEREDVRGLLVRLEWPWIGGVIRRYASDNYELQDEDLAQTARLKLLEVLTDLAGRDDEDLPADVQGYVRQSVVNLVRNKAVRAGRERRYVPVRIEAFDEELNTAFEAEDGQLSGLDVLVMGHAHLNPDTYADVPEAVETREFWDAVDRVVGKADRSALVDAHVLELSQHVVARRLGRSYKATRMHLAKLRERLRKDDRLRELAGSGERHRWLGGRRRREAREGSVG